MEKRRKQIHQSALNMLNTCGVRYWFRYVRNIVRPPNAFLICGTATDKSVTANLGNKISNRELLPVDVVTDTAAQEVENGFKGDVDLRDEETGEAGKSKDLLLGETKDKAVRLAKCHHQQAAPIIHPSHVAEKFSIDMDDWLRARAKELYAQAAIETNANAAKVMEDKARCLNAFAKAGCDLAGEMDVKEYYADSDTRVIRDTKTTGKKPSGAGTPDGAEHKSEQLTVYAAAEKVLTGNLPSYLVLDYLIDYKREGPKHIPLATKRDMADVDEFLARFENAVHSIHTGVFVPINPDAWQCSARWCGFFSICPYARKPKSITVPDLVQIAGV